jgi:hypothetical protein
MNWTEEDCVVCNSAMIQSNALEFQINDSRIELRCKRCNGQISWWRVSTKEFVPLRRTWSEEECVSMR